MCFVFAIQLIIVLLMFQPDKCSSCDQADWSVSLDRATWSRCPNTNTYLRGLWRSPRQLGDERVGRIEYGRCCTATEPSYTNQPAACSNANWLHTLDGLNIGISDFEDWRECNATCGGAIMTRRRTCTNPPPSNGGTCCVGDNLEAKCCNTGPCTVDVDGGWSNWSAYGECSKTCGRGRKYRTRTCTNPPKSGNGKDCKGKAKKGKRCKVKPCKGIK
ncbi:mucin-like protein [Montipora foliosa]|uniref:mucin-like protein n=1 Tax=Montipora foliosa TaxID=591990 RepID=UPI0035F21A77